MLVSEAWDEQVETGSYYYFPYDGFTADTFTDCMNHAVELNEQGLPSNYSVECTYDIVHHPDEYQTVHHDAEYKTVHHDAEGYWA